MASPSRRRQSGGLQLLREWHCRRSHLLARCCRTEGPLLDVGERTLGGHSQARGARLRADTRGCDGGVREELAKKLGIATSLSSRCEWRASIPTSSCEISPPNGVGTERRLPCWLCEVAMRNFTFEVNRRHRQTVPGCGRADTRQPQSSAPRTAMSRRARLRWWRSRRAGAWSKSPNGRGGGSHRRFRLDIAGLFQALAKSAQPVGDRFRRDGAFFMPRAGSRARAGGPWLTQKRPVGGVLANPRDSYGADSRSVIIPCLAECRAGANEYTSHATAPGNEPIARVRPKHTEKSNALSGATP
jgi:hypothetical protein